MKILLNLSIRPFVFFTLIFSQLIFAMDTTSVQTDFNPQGLPIFSSSQHEFNWYLDRLKPQDLKIVNETENPVDFTLAVKQLYGPWPYREIPDELSALQDFSLQPYLGQDDSGDMEFLEDTYSKIRIKAYSSTKTVFFHTRSIRLNPREKFDFAIPYGYLRSIVSKTNKNLSFSEKQATITFADTRRPNDLQALLLLDFQENGQEFYEGFDKEWEPRKKFLKEFYDQADLPIDHIIQKRRETIQKAKTALTHALTHPSFTEPKIPLIMHKIWITGDENPIELPDDKLRHYLAQAKKTNNFKHWLWCKDKTKLQATIQKITESGLPIEIRDLKEIWPEFRGKDIFGRYYTNKRYVFASDIARYNLIYLFGGVYSDFGVEFNLHPALLCSAYDSMTFRENWLCGNSSIASKPKSVLFDKLLKFIDNIDRVPHATRPLGKDISPVPWSSLSILTAMFDIHETGLTLNIPWNKGIININATGSWLGKGKHGQASILANEVTDEEYFGGVDLVSLKGGYKLITGRWDEAETFAMSQVLFGKTWDQIVTKRQQLMETSRETYYQLIPKKINVIPHITHRSWLTNPNNPFEAPKDKLNCYIEGLRSLNIHDGWQHYFWCLDPTKIPKTVEYLLAANVGIQVKSISDIYPQMKGKHIFDAYLADDRYTNANDVSRMNIVNLFGGLYCDLGIEFMRNLTPLIDCYEYLFFLDEHHRIERLHPGNLDHSFIAASPRSEVVTAYLDNLEKLHLLPDAAKKITPTPQSQICWTGCNYMMAYIDSCLGSNTKILFCARDAFHKMNQMSSWMHHAKFGNKPLTESRVDLFSLTPK